MRDGLLLGDGYSLIDNLVDACMIFYGEWLSLFRLSVTKFELSFSISSKLYILFKRSDFLRGWGISLILELYF